MWAAEVSQPVYHTFYEGTSVGVAIRLQGLGLGFRHALVSLACVGIDNDKAVKKDVDGIRHKVLLVCENLGVPDRMCPTILYFMQIGAGMGDGFQLAVSS